MNINRFKQLLESTMGDVKPLIVEQPTSGPTKFKIITTNWSELPSKLETSTKAGQFGGLFYIRNFFQEKYPELNNILNEDNRNDSCCMFESDGVVYLFLYPYMHPAGKVEECTIEKGTKEEYSQYYSGATQMVQSQSFPEGTTDYILIKPRTQEYSTLVILKNGKMCATWALSNPKYPPFEDCK